MAGPYAWALPVPAHLLVQVCGFAGQSRRIRLVATRDVIEHCGYYSREEVRPGCMHTNVLQLSPEAYSLPCSSPVFMAEDEPRTWCLNLFLLLKNLAVGCQKSSVTLYARTSPITANLPDNQEECGLSVRVRVMVYEDPDDFDTLEIQYGIRREWYFDTPTLRADFDASNRVYSLQESDDTGRLRTPSAQRIVKDFFDLFSTQSLRGRLEFADCHTYSLEQGNFSLLLSTAGSVRPLCCTSAQIAASVYQ